MIIAITGKIGTGKSTLAKKIRKKTHAKILEMDKIAHLVLKKPEIIQKIIKIFPENEILTAKKSIDRSKLAKIVFNDAEKLDLLEKITHPPMKKIMQEEIKKAKKEKHDLLVVGALWKKFNFPKFCEQIISVICTKQEAWQRIQNRKNKPTKKAFDFIWQRQEDYNEK